MMLKKLFRKSPSLALPLCFLVAAMGWLFERLSENYLHKFEVRVSFVGLPTKYVVDTTVVQKMYIEAEGSGLNMLQYSAQLPEVSLHVNDLNHQKDHTYQLTSAAVAKLNRQYFAGLRIKNCTPHTLKIPLMNKIYKKIPVRIDAPIEPHPEFRLIDTQIIPDSVKVYGAAVVLDTLSAIYFKRIAKKGLTHSLSEEFALKNTPYLQYEVPKVQLRSTLIRIAQVELTKEIEPLHFPPNEKPFLLPRRIKIWITGDIEQLKELSEQDIKLIADYKQAQQGYIPLQVQQKTNALHIATSHQFVEYLLLEHPYENQ